jgi:hypothetical protein
VTENILLLLLDFSHGADMVKQLHSFQEHGREFAFQGTMEFRIIMTMS